MAYFHDRKNAEEYIKMAEGYDGRELIAILRTYLAPGSSVLELGMGPGKDLDILAQTFTVTGSDSSQVFLDIYREAHRDGAPDVDLILLDAVELDTRRKFNALYSNKVLMHLSPEELVRSFSGQADLLTPRGIALHSFWYGDAEEEYDGLRFVYYTENSLRSMIPDTYEILHMSCYSEMEADDSLYLVLRKTT